ncbi:MAG: hypothetical protein FWD76_02475 [Firmicutes bacterium]|nr:hypothetical protein [Bacillota bacterium]
MLRVLFVAECRKFFAKKSVVLAVSCLTVACFLLTVLLRTVGAPASLCADIPQNVVTSPDSAGWREYALSRIRNIEYNLPNWIGRGGMVGIKQWQWYLDNDVRPFFADGATVVLMDLVFRLLPIFTIFMGLFLVVLVFAEYAKKGGSVASVLCLPASRPKFLVAKFLLCMGLLLVVELLLWLGTIVWVGGKYGFDFGVPYVMVFGDKAVGMSPIAVSGIIALVNLLSAVFWMIFGVVILLLLRNELAMLGIGLAVQVLVYIILVESRNAMPERSYLKDVWYNQFVLSKFLPFLNLSITQQMFGASDYLIGSVLSATIAMGLWSVVLWWVACRVLKKRRFV